MQDTQGSDYDEDRIPLRCNIWFPKGAARCRKGLEGEEALREHWRTEQPNCLAKKVIFVCEPELIYHYNNTHCRCQDRYCFAVDDIFDTKEELEEHCVRKRHYACDLCDEQDGVPFGYHCLLRFLENCFPNARILQRF